VQDDFDAHILNLLEARDSIHLSELQVRMLSPRGNRDGSSGLEISGDANTSGKEGSSPQKTNNTIDGLFTEPEETKRRTNDGPNSY
jgi:hypothetical protein